MIKVYFLGETLLTIAWDFKKMQSDVRGRESTSRGASNTGICSSCHERETRPFEKKFREEIFSKYIPRHYRTLALDYDSSCSPTDVLRQK